MDNDDKQVGQILNRRDALKLLGIGSAAALLAACTPELTTESLSPTTVVPTAEVLTDATAIGTALPMCVVRPEMTAGPYFVDEMLSRSDVRSDPSDGTVSEGAQLKLAFNVSQMRKWTSGTAMHTAFIQMHRIGASIRSAKNSCADTR